MRIGLFTLVQEWGGCEVHTAQLTRTLMARGHETAIVCLNARSYELYRANCEAELPIVSRPIPRPAGEMTLTEWLRFFGSESWDSRILVKGAFGVGNWKLDLAARLSDGDFVTVEHLQAPCVPRTSRRYLGVVPGLGLWWRMELLRGRMRGLLGPRNVICVSDAVRRRLCEEFGFSERRTVVVHNGIDTTRYQPDRAAGIAFRESLGIPPEATVLGAAGRFAHMKGYDLALEGFAILLDRFPRQDLRLLLVGRGDLEADLRARAEVIRPAGRVVFAPFSESPSDVYNALDVFLMPSRTEGLPLALLEAMACGVVPVAAAAGGIPEVLADPGVGWLVPVEDSAGFAAAMVEAVSKSPQQRLEMGRAARNRVCSHFEARVRFEKCADAVEQGPAMLDGAAWRLARAFTRRFTLTAVATADPVTGEGVT